MNHTLHRSSSRCAPADKRRLQWGVVIVLALQIAQPALAQRTRLKPGWNIFSPQQDVEIGREVSKQAEQQLNLLNNRRIDDYLTRLGLRLAAKAPGEKYPYQFKGVNDTSINAFALPGGFLYVNRGTIEAADNEAQLAGVMGHEIGHAALRHGTNQMTKATGMKTLLGLVGGVVGGNSLAGVLTQVGANFGAESILLKYSRDAERQADLVGTQILYDNNYDPLAMAEFFQKLETESRKAGGRPIQFFSSHPNPENRVTAVNAEVANLGGHLGGYRNDSAEFREIQRLSRSLPAPPKAPPQTGPATRPTGTGTKPPLPSVRMQDFSNAAVSLRYPDNWKAYAQGDAFTLAPAGGVVSDSRGNASLAYGATMAVFEPRAKSSGQIDLQSATDQLIHSLYSANPDMRAARDPSGIRAGGQAALATTLTNVSPVGGREVDWLITILRPEGLVYFVFVAPEAEFAGYQRAFQDIINSIRLK